MEVKPGYKRTEIGVIPEDWQVSRVGELCGCIVPGRNKPKLFDGDIPWITTPDLENEKCVTSSRLGLCISRAEAKAVGSKIVPPASVLMSCAGELGIVALTQSEIVVNQQLHVFIPTELISGIFLLFALASRKDQIANYGTKTAVPYLNKSACNSILVPLPTLPEQHDIAWALSDVDALLNELDRLITKKRDLKQAAMQQLLTGKTRLPGFSGEWTVKPLASEMADLEAGISVNSVEEIQSGLERPAILKTSAVANGRFMPSESKAITPRDLGRVKLTARANSVIISRMNTIDLVGECGYVPADYPNLYIPDRLWMTRFNSSSRVSAKWLAFVLSTPITRQLLRSIATGTSGSMKNIAKEQFLSLDFAFPHPEEQEAIADVLTDMDAELTVLEQRLAKTRDIKQSMMQELLTGRTRLISPQEAHA
jgi:type I restriction enzyme S subunit